MRKMLQAFYFCIKFCKTYYIFNHIKQEFSKWPTPYLMPSPSISPKLFLAVSKIFGLDQNFSDSCPNGNCTIHKGKSQS